MAAIGSKRRQTSDETGSKRRFMADTGEDVTRTVAMHLLRNDPCRVEGAGRALETLHLDMYALLFLGTDKDQAKRATDLLFDKPDPALMDKVQAAFARIDEARKDGTLTKMLEGSPRVLVSALCCREELDTHEGTAVVPDAIVPPILTRFKLGEAYYRHTVNDLNDDAEMAFWLLERAIGVTSYTERDEPMWRKDGGWEDMYGDKTGETFVAFDYYDDNL